MNFPCASAPIVYEPPSAALVTSRSSVLKMSDDELDERDSPLQCIVARQEAWKESGSGSSGLRYQLLRDVWMNYD